MHECRECKISLYIPILSLRALHSAFRVNNRGECRSARHHPPHLHVLHHLRRTVHFCFHGFLSAVARIAHWIGSLLSLWACFRVFVVPSLGSRELRICSAPCCLFGLGFLWHCHLSLSLVCCSCWLCGLLLALSLAC